MTHLTSSQINELATIANSGASGSRVAYYTKLAEFGISYGHLAKGVVLEDQLSGRMANAYFSAVAEREGVSVSSAQWQSIGHELMLADLQARLASSALDGSGQIIYPDLGYATIRNYHQQVFLDLGGTVSVGDGVSINAWTAYAPVETLGLMTWDALLTEAAILQGAIGTATMAAMWWEGFVGLDPVAAEWATIVFSEAFQSAVADGSPAQFADHVNGAHIVLGSHFGEQIAAPGGIDPSETVLVMALGGDDTVVVDGNGDLYDAGAGNDTILVSSYDVVAIHGNAGIDTLDFSQMNDRVRIDVGIMGGQNSGSVAFRGVEEIIGTNQNDYFSFDFAPHQTDILEIDAGGGTDTLLLWDDSDVVGVDRQHLVVDLKNEVIGIGVVISSIENVIGGDGDDTIYGNDLSNQISGHNGDDHIHGEGGDDFIFGGSGADTLIGGVGNDTISGDDGDDSLTGNEGSDYITAGEGQDTVRGGIGNDYIYGGGDGDYLYGDAGNDQISGESGNDFIFGGAGDDFIFGNAGDDYLDGGVGSDTLYGGSGADVFCIGLGNDFIADFALGEDRILGSGGIFQAHPTNMAQTNILSNGYTITLMGLTVAELQTYEANGQLWA